MFSSQWYFLSYELASMLKLHALTSWQLDANAFIIRSEKTRARPAFFCNGCTATLRKNYVELHMFMQE